MKSIKLAKWLSLISGILMIIGSLISLLNPLSNFLMLIQIFAVFIVIVGILKVVRYTKTECFHSIGFLLGGIFDVFLGIVIILDKEASIIVASVLIANWIFITAIIEIVTSFELKRIGITTWWLQVITGILGIVLGFLMMRNYLIAPVYISTMVSIYMIAIGGNLVSLFFTIKKVDKFFDNKR